MNISGSTSDILMELQEPEGHHLPSQAFSSHSQFPAFGRMAPTNTETSRENNHIFDK